MFTLNFEIEVKGVRGINTKMTMTPLLETYIPEC